MVKAKSKSRFWTVLGAVNLLTLAYPITMVLGADSLDGRVLGAVALSGAALVLGIADIISVLLAYSMSY